MECPLPIISERKMNFLVRHMWKNSPFCIQISNLGKKCFLKIVMIKSCPVKCTSTTNQKINITSIKKRKKKNEKKNSTGLKTPRPLRSVLQHMCKHDTPFMQRIPEYASVILSASLLFKNLFWNFFFLKIFSKVKTFTTVRH